MRLTYWFTLGWLPVAALSVALAQVEKPAFVSDGASPEMPPSFTGTKGWTFTPAYPATNSIVITQLGVFDSGNDGLANSHQVGLWMADYLFGSTFLASATVPSGTEAPLVDGYRYVSIAPVVLPLRTSTYFIVAAQYAAGDADDLVTPYSARMATGVRLFPYQGRFGYGSDLPFPGYATIPPAPESGGPIFWEPNFQFRIIPEPVPWALFSLSSLFFLSARRWRKP